MKITRKSESSQEDYDFDFSEYEQEQQEEQIRTTKDFTEKKPKISNLKSMYSPSELELQALQDIKIKISEYAIEVAAQTDETKILWYLHACLYEYWSKIRDLEGRYIIKEMDQEFKTMAKWLRTTNEGGKIDPRIRDKLLSIKDKVYTIAQYKGLGLAVKVTGTQYDKAKRSITE